MTHSLAARHALACKVKGPVKVSITDWNVDCSRCNAWLDQQRVTLTARGVQTLKECGYDAHGDKLSNLVNPQP